MKQDEEKYRELKLFSALAVAGMAAALFHVHIPHTDALIDGRWAFGFMGFVLLGHWWAALALCALLSYPYGTSGIPVWVGFWGNMLYAVPCLLLIRPLSGRMVRRLGPGWRFGLGWLALVLACYQAFITPVIWAVIALLAGRPVAAGVMDGWRTQPFLVESVLVSLFSGAAMVAALSMERLQSQRRRLEHINRILAAIRNVNQLIVREKDPDRLLDEACRLLVETRGYYNAWIVLTAGGRPREPFFHAGFDGDFAPMTERLRAGDQPICMQAALSSGGIQVKDDPPAQCPDCPLSHSYDGRTGLALRLEHAGSVFGWMSLSCSAGFARSAEEHDLLKEVAGDLAYALWAIETETQRETLVRKYAAVLTATSDAVVAGDLDGRITVFNPGAEKMFGCTADEALGTPIARFCPADRVHEQAEKIRRVRDEGTVPRYETERLTADGRLIPVEITLGLNSDDRGRPLGINAILRDITERKRAENELRKSESIFRTLVNSIPDLIWLKDADGVYLSCNKRFERFFGACEADIVGKTDHDFVDKDLADFFRENDRKALVAGGPTSNEEQITFADDGRKAFLETIKSPMFDADGKLIGILGIGRDITERKRSEAALLENEIRYKSAQKMGHVGNWEYNLATGLFWGSDEAKRIYGFDPNQDSFSVETVETCIPDRDRVHQALIDLIEKGTEYNLEFQIVPVNSNQPKTIVSLAEVRKDEKGIPVSVIGVIHDITERKRAERELKSREDLLNRIIDESPFATWISDAEGTLQRANPALKRMLNLTDEQLVGRYNVLEDPNVERQGLMDSVRSVFEQGRTIHFNLEWSGEDVPDLDLKGSKRVHIEATMFPIQGPGGELTNVVLHWIDITERKQAEEALRESEERFLLAMKASNDGLFDWNLETNDIYYSPAWKTMLGYEDHELPNDFSVWENMTNPEDVRKSWELQRKLITKQIDRFVMEFKMKHKDGHWVDILSRAEAIFNDSGKAVRIIGTHSNITERKQAEEALRESEERFKALHDASFGGIAIHDQGVILECNQGLSEISGFGYEELIGMDGLLLIAEQSRETVMTHIRSGWEKPYEAFGVRKNGEEYPLRLEARNIPYKGAMVRVVEFRDITERKQAEEALARQQRSINLYNRIANVFLTSPRDEVFADVLDVLLKALGSRFGYFGYIDETGDLVCPSMTRDVWDRCQVAEKSIVFPRAVWGGRWGRSLMEKRTLIANENLRIPEGHVALENALATPIVYNDDLIGQFVVADKAGGYDKDDGELLESVAAQTAPILFGIREEARRKTAQEKLEEQLRQAQKMEAVGRLAGGVAHDFNNMLGVILGHADMLLEEMDPDHPFHADLTEIRKAGARSADLTRQLLAFARKQTVAPKVIDLNKAVEGMLKMLHRLIGEDIDMVWIPGEKVWPVKIDPGQIDQILANLCVNARDAITGVGKVTIETGDAVFDAAYCKTHAGFTPGEYAMLAVSDNGCGMDGETMSHLFEPFFTTKELGKGTGLGLATVYGVVKQNNGFINVYSEPGQGTTFRIYLPRHRAKEAPPPDKEALRPAARGHETILLVEDEPAILKMATMMLERGGYAVVAAGTPGEAVRLAGEHAGDIHLLMTDVVMPEMNGRDLAKNLLSLYPRLKCLFMSGFTANVIAHHGVLDEGVHFIQKPFSKGALTAKLREVLDQD